MNDDDRSERLEKWRKEVWDLQRETSIACAKSSEASREVLTLRRKLAAREPVAAELKESADDHMRRLDALYDIGRENGYSQ